MVIRFRHGSLCFLGFSLFSNRISTFGLALQEGFPRVQASETLSSLGVIETESAR